jgi:hypothetical protein
VGRLVQWDISTTTNCTPSGNLAGPSSVCFDLMEMGDQPKRDRVLKLILRIASWVISAYAAVVIFAISLVAHAEGLAEWAHGNPYKETLLLGLFLSVSAIGIAAIQTNLEHSKRTALIIAAVSGGMSSLTLTVFTVGSLNPIARILNPSNAVEAIVLALATLVTSLRTRSIIKMAFGTTSHPHQLA